MGVRFIALAALPTAVCVLGYATYGTRFPFWVDAARGEAIVLAGLGAGAAVVAGGGPYRALRAWLAAVLLAAAMDLQYTLIALITAFGQRCGPEARTAVFIAEAVFITWPVQATCVVVSLVVVIYAVSGRIGLRGRLVVVGALLLALGLAVALMPGHAPVHCPDGG
jgi:hypothetical protein